MSKVEMNAFEAILRMCADAVPNPWYPKQYARRRGISMEQLNAVLSDLWQEGLLEKAAPHPEHGAGLRLSAKGWQVLNDPKALQRLREGVLDDNSERGEVVRRALRNQTPSYVSRILIGMNVVVFVYGLFLANKAGHASSYLSGGDGEILHQIGLITASDWLHGEWWKTLTACFVHIGVLHILMNMYMLYSSGQYIERIWGPLRFLVIYVLAGVTGTMTGLAANPGGIAGASTALFGIFAAEAVWVLFNGKYLPKNVAREWRNHLLVNVLLLAFISFLPGISGWGHAGGAAAGAAAAVCLHYQRFGPPIWRWAALLGLIPIPLGGLYMIDHERHTSGKWAKIAATPELPINEERRGTKVNKHEETNEERQQREKRERAVEGGRKKQNEVEVEEEKFAAGLRPTIKTPLDTAQTLFNGNLLYDLTRSPSEWVPVTVKKNLAAIDVSRQQLKRLVERLPELGPFKSEDLTEEVKRAELYARELDKLLELTKRHLEGREKWTEEDKKLERKVDDLRAAWQKTLP